MGLNKVLFITDDIITCAKGNFLLKAVSKIKISS